jgi:hypothetical protein
MSLINIINNSFNKFPNKEIKENLTEKELDALILENTNKLISIKTKYDEVKNNWKALREDIESLSMYDRINCGENIKEQFQKAIDDLKLDYIDTKATLDTYKAQKNKLLLEDNKSEDPIIDESEEIIGHLQDIIDTSDTYEVFKYLYNKLVPKSGPANTMAGEIIRALMAIMNGALRNNQVFYDGEGKDKFGSAFYYLTSKGYTDILEDAIGLTGDEYISIIEKVIDKIARDFIYNPELLKTQNMEDYTQFTPIIQEIDEDCGTKKEFKEAFHPSYEELQNGDEIIVGGQHLYVADAEYDDDYVWVTDEKEDRYNKRAPGNTLNKCLIDEVIGQPDEEELDESLKESSNKDDKLKDKYAINENKKELANMRFLKESNFSLTKDDVGTLLNEVATYADQLAEDARELTYSLDNGELASIPKRSNAKLNYIEIKNRMEKILNSNMVEGLNEALYGVNQIEQFVKMADAIGLKTMSDFKDFMDREGQGKDVLTALYDYLHNEIGDLDFHAKNESLKENLSTRKEMIDWIEDNWNTRENSAYLYQLLRDLGLDIEKDSSEDEGFYVNLTDEDLKRVIDILRGVTNSKEQASTIKKDDEDYDSMSREELMDEIDDIYGWALHFKHTDITSIIEDPEVFPNDKDDEEGYFKGVPTNKLRGILKILRKMKNGGSLTKDDQKVLTAKDESLKESYLDSIKDPVYWQH